MIPPTLIDNARNSDIPALVLLLKQLFAIEQDFEFRPDRHARGLERMLAEDGRTCTVLVARFRGKVAGMVSAQTRISTARGGIAAVIEDLVVDAAFRGQGIGSALLEGVEKWAARHDISFLSLLADRDNRPALDFYAGRNWCATRLIALARPLPPRD